MHYQCEICRSPEETMELGRRMGLALSSGAVLAVEGPLGSGKTTLVKGIARALEIPEEITSPTFTLISEHEGTRHRLYHVDLYRINLPDELEELGLEEILAGDGITVIEWPEKASRLLPADSLRVEIGLQRDGSRMLSLAGITL